MRGRQQQYDVVCKKSRGEITIIQDADLEYAPEEISDIIWPIVQHQADVVYGSRFRVKKAARVLYFYHYLANKLLTFLSNLLTNVNLTDIETCYKAFRTPLIKSMPLSVVVSAWRSRSPH